MGECSDKKVVITGGGSGVGFALAQLLVEGGARGLPEASVYAAGKAALRSMARSLSRELLPRGIRVNAISPGPVDTGILENTMTAAAAEQFKAERVADNPMRRFGTPGEIARAAAFLAFDATYAAGTEFVVDGGVTQL
ncbi:SDR family oxidoreductase [Nocardia sp. NPDC004604]|uniref:SDR family oxidoreductase n=1 Tax=Nocardia sp. NPDC004604 TaxID=3157013 RepID=UPI0033AF6E8A